jgi:CHAD domain-containing protein
MEPSETAANFASHSIAKLLERLAYQVGITLHSPGAENVHELRVAIRRFEQAVITFRQGLPGSEVKRIRRKLRVMMRHAGAIRDCDVLQKILLKCQEPGASALKQRLTEERKAELSGLAAVLRRWGARRSSSKWRAVLLPVDAGNTFDSRLPKLARKFLAHGEAAAGPKTSAASLHAFRIEGKKFRYTVELLVPIYGAAAEEWIEKLKPVQSALGDVHDAHMARQIADRFAATPEIAAWLKTRQRKKTREFRRLWQESFGIASNNRRLVAALRHVPRKPMGRSTAVARLAVRHA